ncbi:reverse transcriptase domain-containing protein [Tanacetum coccineum]
MPSNVKTYDGSDDQKDHLKFFQADAKVERWAMPTWCHMFNSTLTGSTRVWFDDLPPESVDSYDDLKKAFLANFLQQKKCIKDPVEIHHIKISNPELIKRLHDKITKSVDEMMKVTTAYLKKEVAASNQVRKKTLPTNQRINQGWKAMARNQGAKTRQRKASAESSKEGRNFRKGQSYGNSNCSTMEKGGQEKGGQEKGHAKKG